LGLRQAIRLSLTKISYLTAKLLPSFSVNLAIFLFIKTAKMSFFSRGQIMPQLPDNARAIVGNILSGIDRKQKLLETLKGRCQAEVSYKLSEVYLQSRFLSILARYNELSWVFFRDPLNVENFDNLAKCEGELMQVINSLTSPSDKL